jgi:hypothetical protein
LYLNIKIINNNETKPQIQIIIVCICGVGRYTSAMKIINHHTTLLMSLCTLSQKIRFAMEPDNPVLINQFLNFKLNASTPSKVFYREQLLAQFQLLIDTIADELLPAHWRRQCLDNIYRPLHALQRIADSSHSQQQVLTLTHELRIISHYLQPGLLV